MEKIPNFFLKNSLNIVYNMYFCINKNRNTMEIKHILSNIKDYSILRVYIANKTVSLDVITKEGVIIESKLVSCLSFVKMVSETNTSNVIKSIPKRRISVYTRGTSQYINSITA